MSQAQTKPTPEEIHENLAQFSGTETWHRLPFTNITYTDGVEYMADSCSAYWLINLIIEANASVAKVKREKFQVWKLRVNTHENSKRTADLICEDGDYDFVYKTEISYTDFPLDEIELWLTSQVLMLPGEY